MKLTTWNYLEAGHGKGMGGAIPWPWQMESVVLSNELLIRVVNEGKDVGSFERLIDILKENLRSIHIEIVREDQISQAKANIDETKLIAFKGTMKVHQVININEMSKSSTTTLFMKSMICFECFYASKSFINDKKLTCKHNDLGTLVHPAQNTT